MIACVSGNTQNSGGLVMTDLDVEQPEQTLKFTLKRFANRKWFQNIFSEIVLKPCAIYKSGVLI